MLYLSLCVPCLKKSRIPKKGLVIKPMIFGEMNSSAQVDLTDMQSQPDGDLKWFLVYQDHVKTSTRNRIPIALISLASLAPLVFYRVVMGLLLNSVQCRMV